MEQFLLHSSLSMSRGLGKTSEDWYAYHPRLTWAVVVVGLAMASLFIGLSTSSKPVPWSGLTPITGDLREVWFTDKGNTIKLEIEGHGDILHMYSVKRYDEIKPRLAEGGTVTVWIKP